MQRETQIPITSRGSPVYERLLGLSLIPTSGIWKSKTMETTKRPVVFQGLVGEGEMNGQSTGDFRAMRPTVYDSIIVDTCHYPFVQTHRLGNTKSELLHKPWTLGDNDVSM